MDIPEAVSYGHTEIEATEIAADALFQALSFYFEQARRMGKKCQEVTRIINLKHTTKIDILTAAFKVFNKQLELSIKPIS